MPFFMMRIIAKLFGANLVAFSTTLSSEIIVVNLGSEF